ncbi:MAG: hypothetical protein QNK04_15125, partial [Myxococcota bacterium]|nr:hypothetical protein [Myxococcota bacterium]
MRRIVVILALLLTGCVSTSFLATDTNQRYEPTTTIEALWATPERRYVVIGKVSAKGDDVASAETVFEELKKRAMREGAHAVVMGEVASEMTVGGVPSSGGTIVYSSSYEVQQALAIRFTDPRESAHSGMRSKPSGRAREMSEGVEADSKAGERRLRHGRSDCLRPRHRSIQPPAATSIEVRIRNDQGVVAGTVAVKVLWTTPLMNSEYASSSRQRPFALGPVAIQCRREAAIHWSRGPRGARRWQTV